MQRSVLRLCGAVLCGCFLLPAQTRVDLKSQSKTIDFSGSIYTRPLKTGTSLPVTCTAGDMFFRLAVSPGSNLYACTSTNTWTLLANSASLPIPQGVPGQVLGNDGATVGWRNFAAGSSGALKTVLGLADYSIDIDTAILPRKSLSESVTGLWNFDLGLALTPRTTPASPANGQLWYDSGSQRFRCQQNGATLDCISGLAANDPAAAQWSDEFCGGPDPFTTATAGSLPWRAVYTGANAGLNYNADSDANHPCLLQLVSGIASQGGSAIFIGPPTGYASINGWSSLEFETQFVFKIDAPFTNQTFRAGLADTPNAATPDNRVTVRATAGLDTQFMFEACTAGACAPVLASGVAIDANWHRAKLFRKAGDAAGTVRLCLDACATSQQIAQKVPPTGLSIFTAVFNPAGGNTSATLKLDWFSGYLKGISRW